MLLFIIFREVAPYLIWFYVYFNAKLNGVQLGVK